MNKDGVKHVSFDDALLIASTCMTTPFRAMHNESASRKAPASF
jgi:hypothetical protein